jgi:O-antigen biosynthesis protein
MITLRTRVLGLAALIIDCHAEPKLSASTRPKAASTLRAGAVGARWSVCSGDGGERNAAPTPHRQRHGHQTFSNVIRKRRLGGTSRRPSGDADELTRARAGRNRVGDQGPEAHTQLVSQIDIRSLYRVILGRPPESEQLVAGMAGQTRDAALKSFLGSPEFRDYVFEPIASNRGWDGGRFYEDFDRELALWCVSFLRPTPDAARRIAEAADWSGALIAIYADGELLRRYAGRTEQADLESFNRGLRCFTPAMRNAAVVGSLDSLNGPLAMGWLWDPEAPDQAATVEFVVEDRVIHRAQASFHRSDVTNAGYGRGFTGFRVELPLALGSLDAPLVHARLAGSGRPLANSPREATIPTVIGRWLTRRERVHGEFLDKLRRRLDRTVADRSLSIVMPVYEPKAEWLREALDSVLGQWCSRWEILCVNDASSSPHVREILDEYAARDIRVRPIHLEVNGGIAKATNVGLAAATGDYVAFMDHDDVIEPDAVFHLLQATLNGADFIYCDELLTTENINVALAAQVRPAFSWDYYLCYPYFVHMVCVRTSIARQIKGWDEEMKISADVDFILRALERSALVAHVPAILYRWRTHGGSAGHSRMGEVGEATLGALNRHLQRLGTGAKARGTEHFNQYRIDFPDDHGRVLVVIPTKNRVDLLQPCVDSILTSTSASEVTICVIDHESDDAKTREYLDAIRSRCVILSYHGSFNYARMNNWAVEKCRERLSELPPYLLFANNDIEVMHEGWLERMRSLAGRSDVGAVGATLLYANDTFQHSGVLIGFNGAADHAHKFEPYLNSEGLRDRGYLSGLISTREYSAVTAACLMLRSEVFTRIGGFDERFAIGFNDTDLCLRIGELGLKVLNDGETVLHHYESATRSVTKHLSHPEDDQLLQTRWKRLITLGGDPFYSPLLSSWSPDHQVVRYSPPSAPTARLRPGLAGLQFGWSEPAPPPISFGQRARSRVRRLLQLQRHLQR